MDRTAWIVVVLCVLGLVLWEVYLAKQTPPRPAPVSITPGQASPTATPTVFGASPTPTASPEVAPKSVESVWSSPEKIETLRNSDVELRLTNRGGGIKEAVLLRQVAEKGQRVALNSAENAPIGALIEQPSAFRLSEFTASAESDSAVQFERTTAEQVTIRKKFFFQQSPEKKDNFVVEMDVDLENRGAKPYQNAGYFVALGSAAPIHFKDYPSYTRLVWCIDGKAKGIDVGWFGGGGGFLGMGQRAAQLPHNEAEIMDFGMFKLVCQFLLNFMNLLHSWLHDYGLAILALTTIIKLTLWPIQNRANRSMRQMAALSPKMQELKEKYKDDPTRMNQEVMKLYKQYGINPVGGCLPMMIQIPIFFGLFKMLGQAVELRNAKFLWVKDLSQPDTIAHLPLLGWPINIIPLCMAATQIWLMAMTPKTGDPTQRRIMMFTPLIFLFICYNFAAALALYYTAQNLFSILQFYQNKGQPMPKLEKVAPSGKRKR